MRWFCQFADATRTESYQHHLKCPCLTGGGGRTGKSKTPWARIYRRIVPLSAEDSYVAGDIAEGILGRLAFRELDRPAARASEVNIFT